MPIKNTPGFITKKSAVAVAREWLGRGDCKYNPRDNLARRAESIFGRKRKVRLTEVASMRKLQGATRQERVALLLIAGGIPRDTVTRFSCWCARRAAESLSPIDRESLIQILSVADRAILGKVNREELDNAAIKAWAWESDQGEGMRDSKDADLKESPCRAEEAKAAAWAAGWALRTLVVKKEKSDDIARAAIFCCEESLEVAECLGNLKFEEKAHLRKLQTMILAEGLSA